MKKGLLYITVTVLIIVIVGLVFTSLKNHLVQNVSIYDVVNLIKTGQVKKVYVSSNQILVQLTNNSLVSAAKESQVSFWQIVKDSKIPSTQLENIKIQIQDTSYSALILGFLFNVLPFIVIGWLFWRFFVQAQKGAGQIFSFSKSGVRIYNPQKDRITFKDIAGLVEAKEEVQEIIEFLKNQDRFVRLGAQIPKGVLLVGPPGSGKTLLARAVACESNVPFLHISGSEFVEMFVGVGAGRVRDTFAMAKKLAPSILFVDELDAVGRARGVGLGGTHEEREQTLNQILVEMDGLEKNSGVIVLSATNRPDVLDQALLRPGRFDRKIVLDLPDIKGREDILTIHLRDKKIGKINLRQVAERTPGFTGADLANLANEAAILAARKNKTEIDQIELLESIEKVILGPERKSKVFSKKEKELAAYHESGHAIVAHYLVGAAPVQKISIISRGQAGGYTIKAPFEEKNFHFKKEFFDELAVMLGGYAAELTQFNDISTGAASDLQIATDLTHQLITRYGMSETFGPMALGKIQELNYLSRDAIVEKDYSEKSAELIDLETKQILDNALNQAKNVIQNKIDKFKKLASYLIKKETIEKKQFEKLIGDKKGSFSTEPTLAPRPNV
ncbi:MAG: ATP-dependent zinc metalloprotease FtsH [Patescibacteria group bacterium]|nr:ATP-dependent zinc metalloprotease FtsH [Patescibacteria group bacterium]